MKFRSRENQTYYRLKIEKLIISSNCAWCLCPSRTYKTSCQKNVNVILKILYRFDFILALEFPGKVISYNRIKLIFIKKKLTRKTHSIETQHESQSTITDIYFDHIPKTIILSNDPFPFIDNISKLSACEIFAISFQRRCYNWAPAEIVFRRIRSARPLNDISLPFPYNVRNWI